MTVLMSVEEAKRTRITAIRLIEQLEQSSSSTLAESSSRPATPDTSISSISSTRFGSGLDATYRPVKLRATAKHVKELLKSLQDDEPMASTSHYTSPPRNSLRDLEVRLGRVQEHLASLPAIDTPRRSRSPMPNFDFLAPSLPIPTPPIPKLPIPVLAEIPVNGSSRWQGEEEKTIKSPPQDFESSESAANSSTSPKLPQFSPRISSSTVVPPPPKARKSISNGSSPSSPNPQADHLGLTGAGGRPLSPPTTTTRPRRTSIKSSNRRVLPTSQSAVNETTSTLRLRPTANPARDRENLLPSSSRSGANLGGGGKGADSGSRERSVNDNGSSRAGGGAASSTVLEHHHDLQASLISSLASMSTQLKTNSLNFADKLADDKQVMENAQEKLTGNLTMMKKEGGRLGGYKSKSRGTMCWTIGLVAIVGVAWMMIFLLIKVT